MAAARQIETAYIQSYQATWYALAQQSKSRLRPRIMVEPGVKGEAYYFDQYGANDGQIIESSNSDSPENEVPQARRQVVPIDWDFGKLIEWPDIERMVIDPTSGFMNAGSMGWNRFQDDRVIAAAFATSNTGKNGSTQVAFPAGNQVAVNDHTNDGGAGNVSLTPGKIITTRNLLGAAEGDDYDKDGKPELSIVCTQKQIGSMLKYVETTSRDYSDAQALVLGKLSTFMGFEFVKSQRMLLDTNGYERVMAFHRMGLGLAIWGEMTSELSKRPDKKYSPYAYLKGAANATRLEEARVYEIKSV